MKRPFCGNARDRELLVRSLGIEVPTKRQGPQTRLAMEVDGPPERQLRSNDGSTVVEIQTHVGNVRAPSGARKTLELYGICTDYAIHRRKGHVWERCLFSEECLQMIRELRAEGQFPFEVEAIPSQAEAEWQIARAAGATERTPAPLQQYLLPADERTLEALQQLRESDRTTKDAPVAVATAGTSDEGRMEDAPSAE